MNEEYSNHIAILVLFFVIIYVSIYMYTFPFIKNDTAEDYTIKEIKNNCANNVNELVLQPGQNVNKVCIKYNKLYYLLNLGLIIDSFLVLFILYFSEYKPKEDSYI